MIKILIDTQTIYLNMYCAYIYSASPICMKYCVLQNRMNQESWSSDESCLRPEAFIRVNRGNVNFMLSLISLCNHVFAYFRVYICVWDLTALGEDNLNSNRAFISLRYNVFELTCFFLFPNQTLAWLLNEELVAIVTGGGDAGHPSLSSHCDALSLIYAAVAILQRTQKWHHSST